MKKGFTLAEVLITLAIIGVVAAISIPSVVANTQQKEFQTGLRKAVSVLNSAITMNMAIDGETPYDNKYIFGYLQRHMSVMKSTLQTPYMTDTVLPGDKTYKTYYNAAFYTTDGMRFEFEDTCTTCASRAVLHENGQPLHLPPAGTAYAKRGCGSYGLENNPNNTTLNPCLILVDVNGDRKPSPSNVNCSKIECARGQYKILAPDSRKINDLFSIMITSDRAVPFGVLAQKTMYQAQK